MPSCLITWIFSGLLRGVFERSEIEHVCMGYVDAPQQAHSTGRELGTCKMYKKYYIP